MKEVKVDSEFGKQIGFTSDKFSTHSFLFKDEKEIYISFIAAIQEGKGHFTNLIKELELRNYKIKIPTPMGVMLLYVKKHGYKQIAEYDKLIDLTYEVWVK